MPSVRRDRSGSNIKIYENTRIVKFYESWETGLLQGEALIISRIETELSGKAILDIGVGAGRTTPALLKLSNRYIGIDIAPSMISACRERFPSVSFEVCDARDLSRFRDNFFDLVFFSFNGIDNLEHGGRLAALREIYRVLAHGGAFAFSSHNLRSIRKKPWHSTKLLSINPFMRPRDYSKHAIKAAIETVNYLRNKPREEYNDGSAFINDGGHGYRSAGRRSCGSWQPDRLCRSLSPIKISPLPPPRPAFSPSRRRVRRHTEYG
jgi:ubiquinone/menaquinone biosynthesis C-methylase UbiE